MINEIRIVKTHKDEFEKTGVRGVTMAFSDSVVDQAWARSGGRCECTRAGHGHSERCGRELKRDRRGAEPSFWWEAHKKVAGGDYTLSNCEILCHECSRPKRSNKKSDWMNRLKGRLILRT